MTDPDAIMDRVAELIDWRHADYDEAVAVMDDLRAVAVAVNAPEHIPSAVWTWDMPYVACSCGWEAIIYDGTNILADVDWGHPNPVDWVGHLNGSSDSAGR